MVKKSADINYISKDLFPKTYNRTMIDDDYIKQLEQENQQLKEEIRKYQKDRDINVKRHLEVQDYIKSRIDYCKEMTGFDCCIEELEKISKMV